MNEHKTTIIAVIITVLVTWLLTKGTDLIDTGADASVLQTKMENGQTIGEHLNQASLERTEIKANQKNIIETLNRQIAALERYAESE